MYLKSVLVAAFFLGPVFAQGAAVESEVGRWLAPVLTSALSLAATFFAYMSGRDKMIYDGDRRVIENENTHLKADKVELEAEVAAEKLEHRATRIERDGFKKLSETLQRRLDEQDESRRRRGPRQKKPDTEQTDALPPSPEEEK